MFIEKYRKRFCVEASDKRLPHRPNGLHNSCVCRRLVFRLEEGGIPIVEEALQPYDAYTADETFLANSLYQLLPVGTVDNRQIGDQVPGPISKQLLAAWSEMVGVDIVGQALHQAQR